MLAQGPTFEEAKAKFYKAYRQYLQELGIGAHSQSPDIQSFASGDTGAVKYCSHCGAPVRAEPVIIEGVAIEIVK